MSWEIADDPDKPKTPTEEANLSDEQKQCALDLAEFCATVAKASEQLYAINEKYSFENETWAKVCYNLGLTMGGVMKMLTDQGPPRIISPPRGVFGGPGT